MEIGRSIWIGFFQQWSQFVRSRSFNWINFTFINFEIEYDRKMGSFEFDLGLLGFTMRGCIAIGEPDDEVVAAITEVVPKEPR